MTCAWMLQDNMWDDYGRYYVTNCGKDFIMEETPTELKFCPFCGRPLELEKPE